ncbi:hypothetical protein FCL47_00025 [Desulfopila sp. IMCC35006]|uniref:OmpA family protein n=1 Tax=Desulfopila sp. IMCC35006 TaxID=2569542 RepID=UPI0010AB654E|nr:OmpA family protein [Desulfopila sp. IMCC35006]TKB27919.1 hypothetical protein FCL47_00025 [Desulfopila sp. IMCC35006]
MTNAHLPQEETSANSSQEGLLEITDFPLGSGKNRYASHFVNIDRRSLSNTVFHIDDNTFTASLPRASHWSIAWSDLMMTMFVLFLSMFAYQTAHQEFLAKKTPEVIGGDTTEALQTVDSSGATFPFAPISPGLPLITAGTIKKVEKIQIESVDPDTVYQPEAMPPPTKSKSELSSEPVSLPAADEEQQETKGLSAPPPTNDSAQNTLSPTPPPAATIVEPSSPVSEEPQTEEPDRFQEIYTLSQDALKNNSLDKFAAIDIVPDKTMRIILTGDLLFAVGESELSDAARTSLQKVVEVMQHTPYMINVVGHTDNLPMRSNRFKSNWELSVARASTVARFLIDEMGMNPNQFVVSGYAAYRPIAPNTTAENRAKNRRVEIIVSKRLPNPVPATEQNLK